MIFCAREHSAPPIHLGMATRVSPPLGCCEECYSPRFLSSAFSPRNGVWLRQGKHVCLTYNQLRGGAVGDPSPVSPSRSCREYPSSQGSTPRLVSLGNRPFLPSWCMDGGHTGLCVSPNPGHTRSSQGANPAPYLAGPEGPHVSAPTHPTTSYQPRALQDGVFSVCKLKNWFRKPRSKHHGLCCCVQCPHQTLSLSNPWSKSLPPLEQSNVKFSFVLSFLGPNPLKSRYYFFCSLAGKSVGI